MRAGFDNKLMSSVMLWLDNKILTTGQAFVNCSSLFYNVSSPYPYYTYSSPYGQIVSDFSVPGANVMTGVYLNNTFIVKGQSGFVDINYDKGLLYFSSPIPSNIKISGNYATKDFGLKTTNEPEEVLIFETRYNLKTKVPNGLSGVSPTTLQYPIVFLRNDGGVNDPFAFGGLDNTITSIETLIFADSLFNLDAITSLFKDCARKCIPLINEDEMPFNVLGGYVSKNYNYTGIVAGKIESGNYSYVNSVSVSSSIQRAYNQQLKSLNPEAFFAIVDFELNTLRYPRI